MAWHGAAARRTRGPCTYARAALQGACEAAPPALPRVRRRFTEASLPAGVCQLVVGMGFMNWTDGADGAPRTPAQRDVWFHALHLVNTVVEEGETYLLDRSTLQFSPPASPRLWLTQVHVHGMHASLVVGGGADAWVGGARSALLGVAAGRVPFAGPQHHACFVSVSVLCRCAACTAAALPLTGPSPVAQLACTDAHGSRPLPRLQRRRCPRGFTSPRGAAECAFYDSDSYLGSVFTNTSASSLSAWRARWVNHRAGCRVNLLARMRCERCDFIGSKDYDYGIYGLVFGDAPQDGLLFSAGFEEYEYEPLAAAPQGAFLQPGDPKFAALRQVCWRRAALAQCRMRERLLPRWTTVHP